MAFVKYKDYQPMFSPSQILSAIPDGLYSIPTVSFNQSLSENRKQKKEEAEADEIERAQELVTELEDVYGDETTDEDTKITKTKEALFKKGAYKEAIDLIEYEDNKQNKKLNKQAQGLNIMRQFPLDKDFRDEIATQYQLENVPDEKSFYERIKTGRGGEKRIYADGREEVTQQSRPERGKKEKILLYNPETGKAKQFDTDEISLAEAQLNGYRKVSEVEKQKELAAKSKDSNKRDDGFSLSELSRSLVGMGLPPIQAEPTPTRTPIKQGVGTPTATPTATPKPKRVTVFRFTR